ncbi:biotin/lipoyl-containing protein [Pseudomonadota bacterium]
MQKKFKVTVNGNEYDVTVEDLSEGSSYILPQPGDMKIPVPEAKPSASPPASPVVSSGPNDLLSPLAGIIVAVPVSAGQVVTQGQDVAVIEAMKMKTTIVAHKAGKIIKIEVQVKDMVDTGQPIVTIE